MEVISLAVKKQRWFHLLGFAIILLTLIEVNGQTGKAQGPIRWSPRERIPGIHDLAESPYLIADRNRTVHAFHSQPSAEWEQERAVVYSQWTLEGGWTMPTDIILPPFDYWAIIKGAFLDQRGIMHIIFYGGSATQAKIYYSQALATSAGRAPAWSTPAVIGEDAIIETAALAGDDQGNLFVLYGGDAEGNGIYALHSADGGDTWSEPIPVFLTYDPELIGFYVHLSLDRGGRLHAVWAVNNLRGTGQAIYYARLEADHEEWSEPLLLAEVGQPDSRLQRGEIERSSWPTIISYGNEVMAMYIVCDPCERRLRRSLDGGQTWTDPVEPFASRGDYRGAIFVVDSEDVLHVILGDRKRGTTVWHSVWQNGRWGEPEPTIPASEEMAYPAGHPLSFLPTDPHAVISQGNVMLISWTMDPGQGDNGTWYSYGILDVPELPLVPLPTLTATPTAIPAATATLSAAIPTSLPRPVLTDTQNDGSSLPTNNPATPLIIGVAPAILLILVTIAVRSLLLYPPHRR